MIKKKHVLELFWVSGSSPKSSKLYKVSNYSGCENKHDDGAHLPCTSLKLWKIFFQFMRLLKYSPKMFI